MIKSNFDFDSWLSEYDISNIIVNETPLHRDIADIISKNYNDLMYWEFEEIEEIKMLKSNVIYELNQGIKSYNNIFVYESDNGMFEPSFLNELPKIYYKFALYINKEMKKRIKNKNKN